MTTREMVHRIEARNFAMRGRLSGCEDRRECNKDADLLALRSMSVERRRQIYRAAVCRFAHEREDAAFETGLSEVESRLYYYLCGIVRDGPDGLEG